MMNYPGIASTYPTFPALSPPARPAMTTFPAYPTAGTPGNGFFPAVPYPGFAHPAPYAPVGGTVLPPAIPAKIAVSSAAPPARPQRPATVAAPVRPAPPPPVIIQTAAQTPAQTAAPQPSEPRRDSSSKKHWLRFLTMTGSIVAGIFVAGYVGTRLFPKALVQEIGVQIKANILSNKQRDQLFNNLKTHPDYATTLKPILENPTVFGEADRQKEALKHVAASDIVSLLTENVLEKTLQSNQTREALQKAVKGTFTPEFVRDCFQDAKVGERVAEAFQQANLEKLTQEALQKVISDSAFLEKTAGGVREVLRQSLPWGNRLLPQKTS